jgi:hypothetical protein
VYNVKKLNIFLKGNHMKNRISSFSALIVVFSVLLTVLLTFPVSAGNALIGTCDFATLETAVGIANSGGGTIDFACSGTITFSYRLTIGEDTIMNSNGNSITFNGNAVTSFFYVNMGRSLTLNGFTLEHGVVTGASEGGAIQNHGMLTINDSMIRTNYSQWGGGAIGNNGTIVINNTTFYQNESGYFGGAIANVGTAFINGSTFDQNVASQRGGGIYNTATLTVTGSTFTDNTGLGMAIANDFSASSQNSHYSNNDCTGGIVDIGGNTAVSSAGCPGGLPIALAVAPLSCVGNDLIVNITAGDANFNITRTTGPNLPLNNVGIASHTINGPGSWTGVTVKELTGDQQSTNLGDITCPSGPVTLSITTCDFASLQAAVASANIAGGTINFGCSGTITFGNQLTITNNVTINENGNTVFFDGGGTRRHFTVNAGASLTLNDFTLQNGNSGVEVGSIYNNGSLTVNGVTFDSNATSYEGGAIGNFGTLNVTNSIFTGNLARSGGAIFSMGGTSVTISGSTFTSNSTTMTGGALNIDGLMTVTNSTFTGNSSPTGGAIYAAFAGSGTITNSIFNANTATINGGGIAVLAGYALTIDGGSTFTGNTAPTGGALHNSGATINSQTVTYTNNTCVGTITNNGGNVADTALGCPGEALTVAPLSCAGDNMIVNITGGDANFDITGTGLNLPANVGIGSNIITGPGTWTGVTVTETDGDAQTINLGDITCFAPVAINASAVCNGTNLDVTITAGNGPFNITATTGGTVPMNGVATGLHILSGTGIWTGVTITETTGDLQVENLGDFDCSTPIAVTSSCVGYDYQINIIAGDGTFDINGTGAGLPITNVGAGVYTLSSGPWTAITVTEDGGNTETFPIGNVDCNIPLNVTRTCVGNDLVVTITGGDGPFNLMGTGIGLPMTNVVANTYTFTGPSTWTGVAVAETAGDMQATPTADFTCQTVLTANAVCNNGNLDVSILTGDANFNITGTGAGLPANGVPLGITSLTDDALGVNSWTGVTVTEIGGNGEILLLGDFNCNAPLVASAICNGTMLEVTATTGDVSFTISDDSLTHYTGVGIGMHAITGPIVSNNLTVTETGGDGQFINLGNFNCSNALNASVICDANGDLVINIVSGDLPINITGIGLGLPTSAVALGTITLIGNAMGTNTWSNIVFAETTGDTENTSITPITNTCNKPLAVTAICVGAALHVTVNGGDVSVDLADGATNIQTSVGFGTLIIPGPINVTALTATETGGNGQSTLIGTGVYNCFASSTLTATATCNGDDLDITISNGNAPFTINVTDSVIPYNLTGQPLGVYTFNGPDTFSNISVIEETGEPETLNLPAITCPSAIVVVPVAPVTVSLAPDPNALGCVLTNNIDLLDAPDNTYCRVLMRDGAVVGYSGAVPTELVGLGVIFAVDMYRLEGGKSVTDFADYTRVCLAGQGRLFYMDSRNAPRVSIELATETIDGMTCGWIPAPGTLVLTSR